MPDSKGELKRYATEYETETGKQWWANPVSHGEQGFASDDFLYWFAFALSTAEQRIEELEKAAKDMEVHNPILHADIPSYFERAKWTFRMQETELNRLRAESVKAEATIAEMKETHRRVVEIQMKELSDLLERNEALDALTKQQRTELTALRAEREKELRELVEFLGLQHNKNGNGWSEEIWYPGGRNKAFAAFLASQSEKEKT